MTIHTICVYTFLKWGTDDLFVEMIGFYLKYNFVYLQVYKCDIPDNLHQYIVYANLEQFRKDPVAKGLSSHMSITVDKASWAGIH